MMEMMAMQEECRLEMMKFYVQSQNPKLFEEIYHDVSYPDRMKEIKAANAPRDQAASSVDAKPSVPDTKPQPQQKAHDDKSLKDLIINNLNPKALDFTPNKFSSSANK